eukprot:gnl/TRDRNA2_/TRDRNA2_116655_c0_seq1.p1 gnl/TRDRNA2_/TRDRNA2_116655_c0~~gnl/TRDRNA2_/TRDRNA2_116655_c0_seq1.p1  ORF type:complete len:322 (-),score=57.41 gnl/TRDRNA2_/TRDRNA2_116655_c0_seq1:132-1055(-)
MGADVGCVGAVYLLSPQQIRGAFKSKSYLVHDRPLFDLMEHLERIGVPTVYPHPSHMYRTLVAKEWPAQLCLAPAFHVPLSTRVPRGSVARNALLAAEEALAALAALAVVRAADGSGRDAAAKPAGRSRGVVKIACSWKSEGVLMFEGAEELAAALEKMTESGDHASYLVQERIEGVMCEASVYLIRGEVAGIRYCQFAHHGAPPKYRLRREVAPLMGESRLRAAEETMERLSLRWLAWARAQNSEPVPFLRIDFLMAPSDTAEGGPLQIWTGEVSELSVAVSLEGLSDEASRTLVFESVIDAALQR